MYRIYTETRDQRERVETAPDEATALRFAHLNKVRMQAAVIAIVAPNGTVTLYHSHDATRAEDDGKPELAEQLRAKAERDLQFLRDDPSYAPESK